MMKLSSLLDSRINGWDPRITVRFDGTGTTWTMPIEFSSAPAVVRYDTGEVLETTQPAADAVRVLGDLRGVPVFIGSLYESEYIPTRIYVRDEEGAPDLRGRLQVRYLDVVLGDTSAAAVVVGATGRDAVTHMKTYETPADDVVRVPIQTRNETLALTLRSVGACSLTVQSLGWEGTLTDRSRRL